MLLLLLHFAHALTHEEVVEELHTTAEEPQSINESDQNPCQLARVMAHQIVLANKARRYHGNAQTANLVHVRGNGHGALSVILAQLLHGYILIVDNNIIQKLGAHMLNQGLHMLIGAVAIGFTGLGHHIADINLHGFGR